MKKNIWISWLEHRRTEELCKCLNIPLYTLLYKKNKFLRYPILSVKTVHKLLAIRPDVLFVQNPSIVLSLLVVLCRITFIKRLVVDSHTSGIIPFDGKYKMLNLMSKFIQRHSDITIVTNTYLKDIVDRNGGRGFVLQDKMPTFDTVENITLKGKVNIVFICSYSWDEPYLEVINAAQYISDDIYIYVTGNHRKVSDTLPSKLPPNVILTGFLGEDEYVSLLNAADVIIDLTTREGCLLCGAYEAISVGKPCILSKTNSLMDYFNKGCIFTENYSDSIARAITEATSSKEELTVEIQKFKQVIAQDWDLRFSELKALIGSSP